MCPEYGATSAYFPVDDETLALPPAHRPGRPGRPRRALHEGAGAVPHDGDPEPTFTEILELDLAAIEPSVAGPQRPQDRVALSRVWDSFVEAFRDPLEPDPTATEVGRFLEEGGNPEVGVDPDGDVEPGSEDRDAQPTARSSRLGRDRRDHELHEHVQPRR